MSSSQQQQQQAPQTFKALCWPQENANQMEMREVEWKQPRKGEIVIKVHAAGLNSTDNISRFNLIGTVHYPTTPGCNVVGEIVQVGEGVKHLKQGQHVAACLSHKGLAEYVVAHEQFTCVLTDKQKAMEESVVAAWQGARIEGSIRRFCREMDQEDHHRYEEINKRMGFEGSGVCVVYGEGGCARMALDILRNCHASSSSRWLMKDSKLVLVTTSEKWNAQDYGLDSQDVLCVSKCDINKELRTRGGAKFVLAVDQPQQGLEALLDGMRYRSEMIVLNPFRDQSVQLPLGNLLAKDLSIRAAVFADSKSIERALELVEKNKIKIGCNKYQFDQAQVNQAWKEMEMKEKFDAPIIMIHSH
ncbi:hypothetical protein JCM5350_002511 [Sporobolomyces pararoseus]